MDKVRTLGPSWFHRQWRFVSDPQLLADENYVTELNGHPSERALLLLSCVREVGICKLFDIDAPGSWTDTLTMTGIVMAADFDEHKTRYLSPEDNFGFDHETCCDDGHTENERPLPGRV